MSFVYNVKEKILSTSLILNDIVNSICNDLKEKSYPNSIFLFSFVGCFFKRDCCIPGVYLRVLSALILVV